MALLAGGGDFDRSLTIVNTAGWDTDCNSGNVGCLLGIRGGLAAVGERWRAPVADRLYLPSADAGEAVTDATRVADRLVALGHRLAGAEPPAAHARKGGARFHFEYPGSVQGFRAASGEPAMVANAAGHSATGSRALAVRFPARHQPPHGRHYPDRLSERSPPRRRLRPARLTDPASRSTAAPRGGRGCRQPRRDHPHPGAGGSHGGRHRTPGRRRAVPGPRGRRGYGVDGAGDRRQPRRRGGRAHRRTGGGRHRLPRLPGLARRTPRTPGPAGQATARRRSWTRRRSAPLPTCRNASPSPQTARPLPAALATGLRCSASDATFDGGAVALLCTEGRIEVSGVHIAPLQETPAT